jgi:hypothetical protein
MNKNYSVTRTSKVGFGYSTEVKQTSTGLSLVGAESPTHTGTIKQLSYKITTDRTLNSLQPGCATYAWFLKIGGEWKKINQGYGCQPILDLKDRNPNGDYIFDSIEVSLA